MNDAQLFDSEISPIPPLRRDLEIIPVQQNGSSFLYIHDARGYATSNLALQPQVQPLLSLIDGRKNISDLETYVGSDVSKNQLLQFIQFLDENRLLTSAFFRTYARETEEAYEQSAVHQSVTAGSSYPAGRDELKQHLDESFAQYENGAALDSIKALYAPHIDPRVGMESYVKAFSPIRNLKPKRVVILATSHYAGLHPEVYQNSPFILVNKDFEMPLGTIKRDRAAMNDLLAEGKQAGISPYDRAHRMEHSIELHLLFLSYLWQHEFEIIPLLVRGLDDLYYLKNGALGKQIDHFSQLLHHQLGNDDETFFLISGDLAHFGKKFGDANAASTLFDDVRAFDRKFLDRASKNQPEEILSLMKEEMDPYRICGFPPLYSFLQSMPHLKGQIMSYDLWDESERESAVTYGSILFNEK
ncbi:MAG TPA: AmmeMemoRadiSam system protein B [Balneolaceae bacterium]|nr:AmmeMemoRadiSam system protein B [Balneolaceae bacterium]